MAKAAMKEDVWEQIDKQFDKTVNYADKAYRTNYYINLIIVAIGILLLLSSLVLAIIRGLDIWTLSFAGLGIADFVALFLVNPQRRIQQLMGDLAQIMVIYRTWRVECNTIEGYLWDKDVPRALGFNEMKNFNAEVNRIAQEALSAIEKYIGIEPKSVKEAEEPKPTKKPPQQGPQKPADQ